MNKKGALELSVNAIVILIIALTILGLVLGFAVSKFRGLSSQLTISEETPTATPQIPIQFPGGDDELTLTKGQTTQMTMSVYNPSTFELDFRASSNAAQVAGSCAGVGTIAFKNPSTNKVAAGAKATTATTEVVFDVVGSLDAGQTGDLVAVVTVEGGVSVGTYACLIELQGENSGYKTAVSRSLFLNIV